MRTVKQWLALPDDKLALELSRAFTPGNECKHDWVDLILRMPGLCNLKYKCTRCALHVAVKTEFGCVPDPIKIDWNTAMEWRDWITLRVTPSVADEIFSEISKIENRCFVYGAESKKWWLWNAQPKHYLIAAATAVEGAKK